MRVLPQFRTSDQHEVTNAFAVAQKNLHFTAVLSVRRARSDERVDSRLSLPNLPCGKKNRRAAFLSSFSQQPFSAGFLSSSSQQRFSAAFLSSFSQQPFSAGFLSSSSQQRFSAAFLSSFSQQPFLSSLLRRLSQQLFSAACLSSHPQLSSCCGQGLVVSY